MRQCQWIASVAVIAAVGAKAAAGQVQVDTLLIKASTFFLAHDLRLSTLRLGIDPSKYPQMAGDYLEYASMDGNLFNEYTDGNYFMWRRYPANLVFVDGPADPKHVGYRSIILNNLAKRTDIRYVLLHDAWRKEYQEAIKGFQQHARLPADGYPTIGLLERLRSAAGN